MPIIYEKFEMDNFVTVDIKSENLVLKKEASTGPNIIIPGDYDEN
tara:strand:+ start:133 stop:267 length:135 start_codon:yes stop_codon:yes gene_type:complete